MHEWLRLSCTYPSVVREVPCVVNDPGEGRLAACRWQRQYPSVVATLTEVLSARSALSPEDVDWLSLLVGDWQLISDLSFADLLLWVRDEPHRHPLDAGPDWAAPRWVIVAQTRPTTGQTAFFDDVVGRPAATGRTALLDRAEQQQRIVRERDPEWRGDIPLREESIPVMREGRVIAVLTRHTNMAAMRTPSRLELTYLATADALTRMIAAGDFPQVGAPTGTRRGAPRVGDGVIRVDVDGMVTYASPNAVSAIHRLGHSGDVSGASLPDLVADLARDRPEGDEDLSLVLTGRQPWRTEVANRGIAVSMRSIPLREGGARIGGVLLVRDVSELRRREQELLTKDATIREIHHRVKNNLQSVAALLRLQARRLPDTESRAALLEAERRVATIALVHDTLSQGLDETVDLDGIIDQVIAAVVDVSRREAPIGISRHGSCGRARSEDATALAMIVSELVQNAAEHGVARRGGEVSVLASRELDDEGQHVLSLVVHDDGVGIPHGWTPSAGRLGTQIVQSFVRDLRGAITWQRRPDGGTAVAVRAVLRSLPGES